MCDYFWRPTEGDLADVVLPGGGSSLADLNPISGDWQLASDQAMAFNEFPNPFFNVGDPLLHELTGVEFFDRAEFEAAQVKMAVAVEFFDRAEFEAAQVKMAVAMDSRSYGGDVIIPQGEEVKRPCSMFPRVVQISPGVGVACKLPSPLAAAGQIMKVSSSSVDPGGGVQISSPQTPGMKRRKNLAKKVVCIPAPAAAAASNRSTGEVVPSDLWAWRKYGQKPIKGSPHPRGYYRCSSSKVCSARKQVERSRTDPNMLVITYTSEHNHPWPTQRNALAGSTRSQPSKSSNHGLKLHVFGKDELKEEVISSAAPPVNEEESAINDSIEDADIDEVFDQGYKLIIPEADHADDFFADLTGLDPDPMSPILSKGIVEAKQPDHGQEEDNALDDPFNMFGWAAGSSFGEQKKYSMIRKT